MSASKPSPVRQLIIGTRLPIPLFEAICHQRELRVLFIKWGPIKELSPIINLKKLKKLHLGSCSIEDLSPIASLTNLEQLSLSNLDRLSDYSPLANLNKLQLLEIEGAPFMPKKVWIDDLRFLASLKKLRGLSICAARFRDSSYYKSLAGSPGLEYLDLPKLDDTSREEIVSSLPNLKYGDVISPTR